VRAPVKNCPLIVSWTVNFTAECARLFVAAKKFAEVSKAGPVVDTSTNIFAGVENFRLEFVEAAIHNSEASVVKYRGS
jgi:hypothetical protein